MAWTEEKNGEIVWKGVEMGIAPSPHKGIANIQNANISTELGEVMASYGRALQSQPGTTAATFSISVLDANHLSTNGIVLNGSWITVGAGITGLSAGNYYVMNSNGTPTIAATSFQLSANYNGSLVTGFSVGPATGNLFRAMSQPVAYAIEPYFTSTQQYRYYVLDSAGLVWVYDTALVNSQVVGLLNWFLPDASITYFSGTAPSGIAVLSGWLMVFAGNTIWVKKTVNLGGTGSTSTLWVQMTNVTLMSLPTTSNKHFALVGHQGKCFYTDGTYVGEIFPTTTFEQPNAGNIQSYALYTNNGSTTCTIGTLISGSIPSNGLNTGSGGVRIPAVFFTDQAGTQPTNLAVNTVYWIDYSTANNNFGVYAASSGGAAINVSTGAVGNQYFNTFFPVGTHAGAGGDHTLMQWTPQRLNLPLFEVSQCLAEVNNAVLVGCIGNIVYPWNQIDPTPSGLIALPENNTSSILTVNQIAYIFAGFKANVYVTDGSSASLAIKVPDYCAGIAGTPTTYVEPYFTWGGTAYIRGRVYFSVLDQTSTKAGNCGGVWSFVPTQNIYIGQDIGLALRLENQNSYATYSGVATIIIPNQTQLGTSPLFWSGWYSSVSSPTYGIDYTSTTPVSSAVIETDALETGTILGEQKQTFANIEYKLSAPLVSGETVTMKYRLNLTDTFTTLGTVNVETLTDLAGYFSPLPFQKTQWLQLQISLNPITSASSSFVRLKEVRLRK